MWAIFILQKLNFAVATILIRLETKNYMLIISRMNEKFGGIRTCLFSASSRLEDSNRDVFSRGYHLHVKLNKIFGPAILDLNTTEEQV